MANTVNVTNTSNTITITPQNNNTLNTSTSNTSINVTQGNTSVVTVSAIGPQGSKGLSGDNLASSDLNALKTFTSSIQTEVDNLTAATSSYLTEVPAGTISGSSQVSFNLISNIPSGLISGSSQIIINESQISDLSHTDISALNTFTGSIRTQVNTLVDATSSYALISDISGAFAISSGSFSTRVTTLETNNTGINTGDQDLSTYALITNISGAFNEPSGSFSTRVTTLETAGYLTSPVEVSAIENFDTEVSKSAAAAGFGAREETLTDISALNLFTSSIYEFTSSIQTQVNNLTTETSSYLTELPANAAFTKLTSSLFQVGISDRPLVIFGGSSITATNPSIFALGSNIIDVNAGINLTSIYKISFDNDTTNTFIRANGDAIEDLEIHADQDILLKADGQVIVDNGLTAASLTGSISASSIENFNTEVSKSVAAAGFGIGGGNLTDISALNLFTGSIYEFTSSIQTKVDNLTSATSSYITDSSDFTTSDNFNVGDITSSALFINSSTGPAEIILDALNANYSSQIKFSSLGNTPSWILGMDSINPQDFRIINGYALNNTNGIFITGSTGYVGLGSLTPYERLTVGGNISASGNIIGNNLTVNSNLTVGNDVSLGVGSTVYNSNDVPLIDISSTRFILGTFTHPLKILSNVTASGNISSSNTIYAKTGSFSHLEGNSPITVKDTITFKNNATFAGSKLTTADIDITGGSFKLGAGTFTSSSLAAAIGGGGDNLGNHTADTHLNMSNYNITSAGSITAVSLTGSISTSSIEGFNASVSNLAQDVFNARDQDAIDSLIAFTGSIQTQVNNLTAVTGSYALTSSISGAFAEPSGGFSTRITTLETAGYLTESPFTALGITGSFNELSASLSTRFRNLETAGYLTSPITTSSITDFNTEVSRSAAAAGFGTGGEGGFTPSLSTDIEARNITASNDISSSGVLRVSKVILPQNGQVEYNSTNYFRFGTTNVSIKTAIANYDISNRINFYGNANVGINPPTNSTIAPEKLTVGGNISASGNFIGTNLILEGGTFTSASLASAIAGSDNLGNHTATQDLNMGGNAITNVGNVDGVDVSALKDDFDILKGKTLVSESAQINITTSSIINFPTEVSRSAAAAGFGAGGNDSDLSSYALIANISGAFAEPSGGFSTRVTTLETNNTGTNTGDQDLSSYALIANISGAFNEPSGGFSTRITTLETEGGSGFTPSLSTNITALNITASANISASGNLLGNGLILAGGNGVFTSASLAAAQAGGDNLGNHTADTDLNLNGNSIHAALHITASGNISASGEITATSFNITGQAADLSVVEGTTELILSSSDVVTIKSPVLNLSSSFGITTESVASPYNGYIIYDNDQHKFFGYANGSWVKLHD